MERRVCPVTTERMRKMLRRDFLNGVVDIHIHAGPSVANRKVDALEMLRQAEEAGYAGFLVKDHYVPSTHGCLMVEKHFSTGCRVFSSVAMNNSMGGFNLNALDAAYNMGAKIAYMPTVSSKLHIDGHKGKSFHGSGAMTAEETPIYYLDGDGKLIPEVLDVLDYMAAHPDFVLATGHGSPAEIDVLIDEAFARGVKKIVVNHPHFSINASEEQVVRWARAGAFIEITAMEHGMVLEDRDDLFNSIDLVKRVMDSGIPAERIVISSDFGQAVSPYPVEGMYKFLDLLYSTVGIDEDTLTIMVKDNPARLMGMKD